MTHRAKIFWFPAFGKWMIRCLKCGETLSESPETVVFDMPGECHEQPRSLTFRVAEKIDTEDKMR
jgi:hypothetical protein